MSREMNMNMLGKAGEALVSNLLQEVHGWTVSTSVDQYDNTKDMIATRDGVSQTIEVKTQQRYHMQNAFTVKPSQVQKCKNVDQLVIVETPSKENGNKVIIWNAPHRNFFTTMTSHGKMYCLDADECEVMGEFDDFNTVNAFRRHSVSEWRGK